MPARALGRMRGTIRAVTQPPTQVSDEPPDLLLSGRDALARHVWAEAFDLLSRAESERPLSGADLESLAEAAFFAGRGDARVEIKERAFATYQAEENRVRAAYLALDVANELTLRGKSSIASAWVRRAERLLVDQPESYVHGFLALMQSSLAKYRGETSAALNLAESAVEISKRAGNADLAAMSLTGLAQLKIAGGAANEGMSLLEEAAIAAVSGELSPITAGITSCQMIAACRDLTDYGRANEWLEATDRWCEKQEVSGFPGICRVHRAEILALHGGWDRAEAELRQATTELKAFDAIMPMADGLYAIGEIRRLKGDFPGAEEALREAHALGRSPQPALALLRLGAGQLKPALAAVEAALRDAVVDQWARARLLAAQVEIAVAAGDPRKARTAVDELVRIVEQYDSPALQAGKHEALGRVLHAEGDSASAIGELRSAMGLWRQVGATYEVARVRVVLADALGATGNDEGADLERRAARDEFQRLGAKPDLVGVEAAIRITAERKGRTLGVRKTFLFTDIVGSTNLAEALGDASWEQLLRWHDQTLRDLFATAGGEEVNSTGDGFFVAFDAAPAAVACAMAVQRALAEHRQSSGFAPPVRIGIHTADATQRGDDYSGIGVHVAARIAALADGGQILISQDALNEAGMVPTSDPRQVQVKGVTAAIAISTIEWS